MFPTNPLDFVDFSAVLGLPDPGNGGNQSKIFSIRVIAVLAIIAYVVAK